LKRIIIFFVAFLIIAELSGQEKKKKKVYKFNYAIEAPAAAGLFAFNYWGFTQLKKKDRITEAKINALNKDDVWIIDRIALQQSASQRFQARDISDWAMNIFIFSPALLYLDKEIRQSWLDIALLYLETQAINSNLYTWGGPMFTERIRPLAYYDQITMEEKMERGTTDSFFSGHVSWTAGASFFMAKVISDYHPELGHKKWWLFLAALAPPAFVGYHRMRGLKHFPTDVIVGTIVGAAVGVLNPHFHKIHNSKTSISAAPFAGEYSGLAIRIKF
jgi:membrane-associated phospholipid phosphatase